MKVIIALLLLIVPAYGEERGSDEEVREIIQHALDEALHDRIKQLFAVWLKDAHDQPHRASVGVRQAVTSYRHAIKAIETEKLTWKSRRVAKQ